MRRITKRMDKVRWKYRMILIVAVVGLLSNCSPNTQEKRPEVSVNETHQQQVDTIAVEKRIASEDTCHYKFVKAGIEVLDAQPPIYHCLQTVRHIPLKLANSIQVFHQTQCGQESMIDSLVIFYKTNQQIIKLEYAKAYWDRIENLKESKCIKFVHCNNDNYPDLVICSGRSGNGHAVTEILKYNNRLQEFEYDTLLSNEGSLCYDKMNNTYQTYDRGGQLNFLYRRFKLKKGKMVIIEELDLDMQPDKSNRERTCIVTKHRVGKKEVVDTLYFKNSDLMTVEEQVRGLPILKRFKEFSSKYGIQ